MVHVVNPKFAILINPGSRVIDEVSVLRESDVPTFNFGLEALDDETAASLHQLSVEDPTARMLEGTTRSPWVGDDVTPGSRHPVPPYAYLMQRLLAERLDI